MSGYRRNESGYQTSFCTTPQLATFKVRFWYKVVHGVTKCLYSSTKHKSNLVAWWSNFLDAACYIQVFLFNRRHLLSVWRSKLYNEIWLVDGGSVADWPSDCRRPGKQDRLLGEWRVGNIRKWPLQQNILLKLIYHQKVRWFSTLLCNNDVSQWRPISDSVIGTRHHTTILNRKKSSVRFCIFNCRAHGISFK